jgi:hypothetical protein
VTIGQLIRELSWYPKDKEIEIECPNGLLVRPRIKVMRDSLFAFKYPVKSYVITWQD